MLLTIEYSLGEIAMEQAQYQKALQYFQSVAAIDPTNAEAWYNIAEAYNLLEQVEEAEINYARAIALEPEIIDYFTALSRMHMEHGQSLKSLLSARGGFTYQSRLRAIASIPGIWLYQKVVTTAKLKNY